MAETRSQTLLKKAMMNETEEVLESRLEKLQETIDDQNAKIGERIHALLLLLRSRKANEENHEDQSPNDKELGKAEVATKSIESDDPTVKNEANAKVISAIVKDESILQTQVPIVSSTPKLNFETEDIKSGTQSNYGGLTRLENVDFLRFDGDKIREWLFKVEEFFEIAQTPDGLKICVASAHFDGLAATWHQSFVQSKLGRNDIHDWNSYKILLERQFEEVLDDPIDELKQLRETNGIAEYHTKFELLRTRMNLTEEELVRSFLDGLQPETQANVEMFQPQTVSQCLSIGRLYEQAHPKMVSNQSWSGSKWSGNGNQLKGILDCEEDQLSRDDNELVNIEVTTSTDLLLPEERDTSPQIAIGCELEAGETDSSINQNQLIQEEAKNHSIDSFHETSLLHHKSSLLKHQVSISHWEFSHRSPIESLDVYDDWPSAIVRTHQSQSNFDLEYAAINAYQVCDSMSLGTKLLTNGKRKTFLKTWRFKFKDKAQPRQLIQEKLGVHEANATKNQLRTPTGLVVDDLHGCGSDIFCVQYFVSSIVAGDFQETQWLFNDELHDIKKCQIVIEEDSNSYGYQEFNGMRIRSHMLHHHKKPSKSPKSWKFKFKSENLRKMEVNSVLDNREVVVGVVERIRQVMSVTKPVTIKQQRGFLGLSDYYRRFVQHFGSIASLLYALSKKDSFIWSPQAQKVFKKLKLAPYQAPKRFPTFEP